jgi:uncharacterized RDD family membrane protein YckC
MKCKKCGNEYPSKYYFATEDICKECFNKMPPEEQALYFANQQEIMNYDEYSDRVGFGQRFGAVLIDLFLLWIIMQFVQWISGFNEIINELQYRIGDFMADPESASEFIEYVRENLMPYYSLFTAVFLVYFVSEPLLGFTPGKYILKLRITQENKQVADTNQIWLRYIIKYSSWILFLVFFIFGMLEWLMIPSLLFMMTVIAFLFTLGMKKSALYDIWTNTAVYRLSDIK